MPRSFFTSGFFISGILPGDWEFFKIWGYLYRGLGISHNLGIFIPGIEDFLRSGDLGFLSRGLGIFQNLGIFILGIEDFLKFGDFYPGDFCQIPGIRDFMGMRILWRWGFFFVGWDIPPKSHLW